MVRQTRLRLPAIRGWLPRSPTYVRLTHEDLEIAETACRANAARCRRKGTIEEAEHWKRVADHIARADPAMVERGLNTLADLGERHSIWAFCRTCDRSTRLPPIALSQYLSLSSRYRT